MSDSAYPFRRTFVVAEGLISLAAIAGSVQLFTDTGTDGLDPAALDKLGLSSWTLPGVWLLVSVAAPSTIAFILAWRRSPHAASAVLVASGLLLFEVLVQIPFIGPSMLQLVLGIAAIVLGALAVRARSLGWR